MATLETAEDLLEQLRAASYDAAQRDLQDIKDFAAEQGFSGELAQVGAALAPAGASGCLSCLPRHMQRAVHASAAEQRASQWRRRTWAGSHHLTFQEQ